MGEDERAQFLQGEFTLESEGRQRPFVLDEGEAEEEPPALYAGGLKEGVWKLAPPKSFDGLTSMTSSIHVPDLMLAFADTSGTPLDNTNVQQALLVVLKEPPIRGEIGYEGNVIFDPKSFEESLHVPSIPDEKEREFAARLLLEQAGYKEGFSVQIQAEGEGETLLEETAGIVQQRLLSIRLDAEIAPCIDACIKVFLRTES
jgi:hypothetical protein